MHPHTFCFQFNNVILDISSLPFGIVATVVMMLLVVVVVLLLSVVVVEKSFQF